MAALVALIVVGFGVWFAPILLASLDAKWERESETANTRNAIRARYAKVAEREITLAENRAEKPNARQPMPADLVARINAWEDEFARADEQKFVEQLYAETGDWDAVRRAYAPQLADNQPEHQVNG